MLYEFIEVVPNNHLLRQMNVLVTAGLGDLHLAAIVQNLKTTALRLLAPPLSPASV